MRSALSLVSDTLSYAPISGRSPIKLLELRPAPMLICQMSLPLTYVSVMKAIFSLSSYFINISFVIGSFLLVHKYALTFLSLKNNPPLTSTFLSLSHLNHQKTPMALSST